jgi:hypothetical protein
MENSTLAVPKPEQLLKIDINGKFYDIAPGRYSVVHLKRLASIPLADELERVVNQRLHPLADDAVVEVHQCEWFVSHPRDCQSS